MASLGSSSGLLLITDFINDLEAIGNVALITSENHTILGRPETSGESRRKSGERCREAADGSRGLGNTTTRFNLIQGPGLFFTIFPEKRALVVFVDMEGIHERSDKKVWFKAPMGSLLAVFKGGDGALPMVLARSLQYIIDS